MNPYDQTCAYVSTTAMGRPEMSIYFAGKLYDLSTAFVRRFIDACSTRNRAIYRQRLYGCRRICGRENSAIMRCCNLTTVITSTAEYTRSRYFLSYSILVKYKILFTDLFFLLQRFHLPNKSPTLLAILQRLCNVQMTF